MCFCLCQNSAGARPRTLRTSHCLAATFGSVAATWLEAMPRLSRHHRRPLRGAPSAGHEHGPKARHEMTRKIPLRYCNSLLRLISCAFVCHEGGFRVSVRCRKPIGLRGGTTHGGGRRRTSRCVGTPRIRREASSGNVPSVRGRASAHASIVLRRGEWRGRQRFGILSVFT